MTINYICGLSSNYQVKQNDLLQSEYKLKTKVK
jgi:hypothetical protein